MIMDGRIYSFVIFAIQRRNKKSEPDNMTGLWHFQYGAITGGTFSSISQIISCFDV